jgi:hypothetical protein
MEYVEYVLREPNMLKVKKLAFVQKVQISINKDIAKQSALHAILASISTV